MAMIGRNATVAEISRHRRPERARRTIPRRLARSARDPAERHRAVEVDAFLNWGWDYFDRDHAATIEAMSTPERLAWANHGEDIPHIVLD